MVDANELLKIWGKPAPEWWEVDSHLNEEDKKALMTSLYEEEKQLRRQINNIKNEIAHLNGCINEMSQRANGLEARRRQLVEAEKTKVIQSKPRKKHKKKGNNFVWATFVAKIDSGSLSIDQLNRLKEMLTS